MEVKDEEHADEGGEGAGLAKAGQAPQGVAATLLWGEGHAERILGLKYGVHAEATYEYPGNDGGEAVGGAQEPVSDGQQQHGPGGKPLQRHSVEECHEQYQKQAACLADGRHVAELRPAEVKHVLEVVGDYAVA
jgi:hypothetical protein